MNIQLNGKTYKPTGGCKFGGNEYSDGSEKFIARIGSGGVEVFCGTKDFKYHYRPLHHVTENEMCWWVDESNYDLTGYKLLD